MPINFPINPTIGQTYTYDSKTWEWEGSYWKALGIVIY